MICLEMGWTEKQLKEENTQEFLDELVFIINHKNRGR
jgi:hypothetical protein